MGIVIFNIYAQEDNTSSINDTSLQPDKEQKLLVESQLEEDEPLEVAQEQVSPQTEQEQSLDESSKSQEAFLGDTELIKGKEAFESSSLAKRIRWLIVGITFAYLSPLDFQTNYITDNEYTHNSIPIDIEKFPTSLEYSSYVLHPAASATIEFPFIFGFYVPIFLELTTKLGFSFMSMGIKPVEVDRYFVYKFFDVTGDINIKLAYYVNPFIPIGIYVASGIGFSYPIFRAYGYYKNSIHFPLGKDDRDYTPFFQNEDKRLKSDVNMYINTSLGVVLNGLYYRNVKISFGYVFRQYFLDEINNINMLEFGNTGQVAKLGFNNYKLFHGLQIEIMYIVY